MSVKFFITLALVGHTLCSIRVDPSITPKQKTRMKYFLFVLLQSEH
jgi:hypothetical protein